MIYILTDIIHGQDDSEIYMKLLYIEYLAKMYIYNKLTKFSILDFTSI